MQGTINADGHRDVYLTHATVAACARCTAAWLPAISKCLCTLPCECCRVTTSVIPEVPMSVSCLAGSSSFCVTKCRHEQSDWQRRPGETDYPHCHPEELFSSPPVTAQQINTSTHSEMQLYRVRRGQMDILGGFKVKTLRLISSSTNTTTSFSVLTLRREMGGSEAHPFSAKHKVLLDLMAGFISVGLWKSTRGTLPHCHTHKYTH